MLPSNKKERTTNTGDNIHKFQKYDAKWIKSGIRHHILYDSIYITFYKGKLIGKANKLVITRGWGVGGAGIDHKGK